MRLIIVLVLPFVAGMVQWSFWDLLRPEIGSLLFPAILLSALLGGARAGLVATLVAVLLGWWLFLPPSLSWRIESFASLWSILLLLFSGALMSLLLGHLQDTVACADAVATDASGRSMGWKIMRRLGCLGAARSGPHKGGASKPTIQIMATPAARTELRRRLSGRYRLAWVADQGEALEQVRALPSALLVLAGDWPGEVVEDLILSIRRLPGRGALPVMLIGGHEDKVRRQRLIDLGVRDFVAAQCPEHELNDRIDRLVAAPLAAVDNLWNSAAGRFEAVVDASPMPHALNDASGRILHLNAAFVKAFGYTLEDIPSLREWWPRAYPDAGYAQQVAEDWHRYLDRIRREAVVGESVEVEIRCKDGRRKHMLVAAAALDDVVDGNVLVTFVDISERKRVEARLAELLDEQQAILQSEVVGIATLQGQRLVWANSAFARMFGYSRDQLVDQPFALLEAVGDEARSQLHDGLRSIFTRQGVHRTQVRLRRRDGSIGWFDLSGTRLHRHGDKSVLACVDISAQKQVEAELIEANEEAQAANLSKSRFLSTMSHEIRTPMNGILGMAQLLTEPEVTAAERRKFAGVVLDSGNRLLALLNDILDLSRLEAGRLNLASEVLDPRQILADTHALFLEPARRQGLSLRQTEWDGGSLWLLGDAGRLQQMLSKLVGNALKFTEQGEICLEFKVLAEDERGAELEFVVLDSGIGITEQHLPDMFLPFSQLDSSISRSFVGSGLGLAIVRGLARKMGGEAGVSSRLQQGSRFWFRVLLGKPSARQIATALKRQTAQQAPLQEAARERSVAHILVAEDDAVNRQVIEATLAKLGLVVHSVDNGREAVACLAEGARPDLVFMDIHMPVMDGYQATREIRRREQRQQLSRVPIIALSASVTMEEQSVCRDAGMDGFLGKPLALDQLQQLLRRWLPVAGQPAARAQTPASAPAAGYAVDAAGQVATIAHDLLTELAQHKYDAVGRFADLRAALGEAEGAAEVAAAERCVETFDFEGARELLRKTAIAQGWIGEML